MGLQVSCSFCISDDSKPLRNDSLQNSCLHLASMTSIDETKVECVSHSDVFNAVLSGNSSSRCDLDPQVHRYDHILPVIADAVVASYDKPIVSSLSIDVPSSYSLAMLDKTENSLTKGTASNSSTPSVHIPSSRIMIVTRELRPSAPSSNIHTDAQLRSMDELFKILGAGTVVELKEFEQNTSWDVNSIRFQVEMLFLIA
jgi:hypothetical protein